MLPQLGHELDLEHVISLPRPSLTPFKMVKVKMLRRNPLDYVRETKHDIHKVRRNYDPSMHPMREAREYQAAVNAAKLVREGSIQKEDNAGQFGNFHFNTSVCSESKEDIFYIFSLLHLSRYMTSKQTFENYAFLFRTACSPNPSWAP